MFPAGWTNVKVTRTIAARIRTQGQIWVGRRNIKNVVSSWNAAARRGGDVMNRCGFRLHESGL